MAWEVGTLPVTNIWLALVHLGSLSKTTGDSIPPCRTSLVSRKADMLFHVARMDWWKYQKCKIPINYEVTTLSCSLANSCPSLILSKALDASRKHIHTVVLCLLHFLTTSFSAYIHKSVLCLFLNPNWLSGGDASQGNCSVIFDAWYFTGFVFGYWQ